MSSLLQGEYYNHVTGEGEGAKDSSWSTLATVRQSYILLNAQLPLNSTPTMSPS